MAKYIDVGEALKKVGHVQIKSARNDIALAEDRRAIANWLRDLPGVTVQEVRHGYWRKSLVIAEEFTGSEPRGMASISCSECNNSALLIPIGGRTASACSPYCPWCGAKMDEVEE